MNLSGFLHDRIILFLLEFDSHLELLWYYLMCPHLGSNAGHVFIIYSLFSRISGYQYFQLISDELDLFFHQLFLVVACLY